MSVFVILIFAVKTEAAPSCALGSDPSRLSKFKPGVGWSWTLEKEKIADAVRSARIGNDQPVVYDADMFALRENDIRNLKSKSKIVICYVAGGSIEYGSDCRRGSSQKDYARSEMAPALSAVRPSAILNPIQAWPTNCWLDPRDPSVLRSIKASIDIAFKKGCDGIEFDNMDLGLDISNIGEAFCSPGELDEARRVQKNENAVCPKAHSVEKELRKAQLKINKTVADYTHEKCMLAGMKNGHQAVSEQCREFDFGVAEEIVKEGTNSSDTDPDNSSDFAKPPRQTFENWRECAARGKPVFVAEYQNRGGSCDKVGRLTEGLSVNLFSNNQEVAGGVSCDVLNSRKGSSLKNKKQRLQKSSSAESEGLW